MIDSNGKVYADISNLSSKLPSTVTDAVSVIRDYIKGVENVPGIYVEKATRARGSFTKLVADLNGTVGA